jgi:hypothetical protein
MLRLLRLAPTKVAAIPASGVGPVRRVVSPDGASTLITSAP